MKPNDLGTIYLSIDVELIDQVDMESKQAFENGIQRGNLKGAPNKFAS